MPFNVLYCCGVKEFYDLGDAISINGVENTVADIAQKTDEVNGGRYPCAFILFTGVSGTTYGQKLEAFILEHELGDVWSSGYKKNPNSGRRVKCWIWGIDRKNLNGWLGEYVTRKIDPKSKPKEKE